jgi:hypothetical protein
LTRFKSDQLSERIMVKDMGGGNREVEIRFDDPIIITSRRDEGLLTPKNFSHPQVAYNEDYPDGAFAYSLNVPMALNFPRPLHFESIYLKAHRDPKFFQKSTIVPFNVQAFLGNQLVMNVTIHASSLVWKKYMPQNQ